MDPCSFVRIVIGNLALKFPERSHLSSLSFYCKFKLKGFPTQVSDVTFLAAESDAVESRIQACFSLRKPELEKLVDKSSKFSCLKMEVYRRSRGGSSSCGFVKSGKLLGCVALQLDLKSVLESNGNNRGFLIQNGWILVGGPDVKLHLNVRAEPDPRFVFQFDGEPECSPQMADRKHSSISCFSSSNHEQPLKERKGWSNIPYLSGSPCGSCINGYTVLTNHKFFPQVCYQESSVFSEERPHSDSQSPGSLERQRASWLRVVWTLGAPLIIEICDVSTWRDEGKCKQRSGVGGSGELRAIESTGRMRRELFVALAALLLWILSYECSLSRLFRRN
ncbi:UNVERIFIED_CONTAM: hypothetical protein Scaly_0721300 [Sesamum calycinum]|uniref:Uncharacterized protein n=1 Tax=Sesamum calycinum TaxID=2727403 RepID=A0AAW2R7D3_9LAMI